MAKRPKAFKDLKTDHLKCRALAHHWDPIQTTLITHDRRRAWEVSLVCLVCKSPATDIVYMTDGMRAKPRAYHHAEGYLIDNVPDWGGRKEFNANVRRELYTRLEKGGK